MSSHLEHDAGEKATGELNYWQRQVASEGELANTWYQRFYTSHFELTKQDYAGQRILDIGCGPRGSLEWAALAEERVGLDPLSDRYLEMGADRHKMSYVTGGAEKIPFDDAYFDIVCSFNSLDHVDNLRQTIHEIKRVVKPGGLFLLLCDVHEEPTPQEPICFDWGIVNRFSPEFEPQSIICYEKNAPGMYQSIELGDLFDHSNPERRYGILSARFIRVQDTKFRSLMVKARRALTRRSG